jgi:hypothetical protein
MSADIIYRGFSAGEMSPDILGRTDLDKYQLALGTCRNFVVSPLGPASNRPGFQYVLEAHDSTHLCRAIPFKFNSGQTYIIELGHLYFRVHTQGGTLLEAAKTVTGLTSANPGVITSVAHGFANGDRVFLDAVGGMPGVNDAFYIVAGVTANTFQLRLLDNTGYNTTSEGTYTSGGTVSRVLKVATLYDEVDLLDLHYTQSGDVLTITHPELPCARDPSRLRHLVDDHERHLRSERSAADRAVRHACASVRYDGQLLRRHRTHPRLPGGEREHHGDLVHE